MSEKASAEQQQGSGQGNEQKPAKASLPAIYFESLEILNYRGIEHATFKFQPGLNVIIGANSTSKTTLIDALRIVLNLGTFEKKRDFIKVRPVDVFIDRDNPQASKTVMFKATLRMRSDRSAQFYDMRCPDEAIESPIGNIYYEKLQLSYSLDFEYSKARQRYQYVRSEICGGPTYEQPVASAILDYIEAIYLAPLRDLANDKAQIGVEIENLIESHTIQGQEEQRTAIPETLQRSAVQLISQVTGNAHQDAAGENLSAFARPYNIGSGSLSFAPGGISDRLLRTMEPLFEDGLHGQDKLPLSSNGLGINQLIYASIVLSRRGSAGDEMHKHRFFLIEEPEAHLHPQLQDSFFSELNKITDHQIFVTSHSPTITAKTDIGKITVLQRDATTGAILPLHLADVFTGDEGEEHKRYLHKFLDVTRSQLLFASGAVFVEGVTEGMLMQPFSEILGLNLRDHAIEVVVVDSDAGFDHFRPLFDHPDGGFHRAVFITDSDLDPAATVADDTFKEDGVGDSFDLSPAGNTALAIGCGTFEFGLLRASTTGQGNEEMQRILADSMAASAPGEVRRANAEDLFVQDFLDFKNPLLSYRKMKCKKSGDLEGGQWYGTWTTGSYFKSAKSNFAFHLEDRLTSLSLEDAGKNFVVPQYIKQALRFALKIPLKNEVPADGNDN